MAPNRFQRGMQRVAKGLFGISFGGAGAETWQDARNFELGLPIGQNYGARVTEPYRQSSAVAVAISRIARDASSVPWEVYPAGGSTDEEPLDDHPILDTFANPNPYMVGTQLWVASYVSILLFGECWWYYPDLAVKRPGQPLKGMGGIELIDPRCVVEKDGRWYARINGVDVPLVQERLTQFKRWNPYNHKRGLSMVESVMADLQGDYAAAQWNERFFSDQNGMPSGILKPAIGTPMTDDQRRDLRRTWNQRHSGTKRSVAIVPPGWEFDVVGISQQDMGFRELREYSREQILAAFGVPPFLAGVLDKANYANAREQKEVYWQHTLKEFLGEWQEAVNGDFLPKIGFDDIALYPKWEVVNALLEDLAEKTAVAKEWFSIGLSKRAINERLEMGWDPDTIPDYETGYLPINLIPSTMVEESFAAPEPEEPDPDAPEPEVADDEDAPPKRYKAESPDAREQRRSLVWKQIVLRVRDLEMEFERKVRSHFKQIEKDTLETVSQVAASYKVSQLAGVTKADASEPFDLAEADRRIRKATQVTYREGVKRGGESIAAELAGQLTFDLHDPRAIALLTDISGRLKRINRTVAQALMDALAQGLGLNETVDQLRDRVRGVMQTSLGRARTIARTETTFAFNGGRNVGMIQAGIKQHEWLSSRDPDVRDTHAEVDGSRRNIGEPFPNGLQYPGDPTGPSSEVINCRCVAVPVVER